MQFLKTIDDRTRNLALSYLTVIMTMSILFSVIIYVITSSELNRPLPPVRQPMTQNEQQSSYFEERLERRNEQARASLLFSLALLNLAMLVGGSAMSYILARRTLEPIEQAMKKQSQFVSDASHELRTPLTALLTSNEIILRKKNATKERMQQTITRNVDEVKKLRELSNQLLDLAKSDAIEVKDEEFNIAELIDSSINRMKPMSSAKNIEIINHSDAFKITGKISVIEQILQIYIDNSIKYSPAKSKIIVKTEHKGTNKIRVSVCDNAGGIDDPDKQRVFERFYRTDSSRNRGEMSGHGLGLAIAKSLAEKNGYTVGVSNYSKVGSEFWIET